jgi:microcystin-dependent protein
MAEPFLGQIIIVGFNFAPRGWALCNGQILSIAQNTALFSLLGTTYGGNGQTTFALPNLQGRVALHAGQGAGLSERDLGEVGGEESVTLNQSQMPVHTHTLGASGAAATTDSPANAVLARSVRATVYGPTPVTSTLAPQSIAPAGGSQPHDNMPPYLVLNYCIALEGIFPSRN